MTAYDNLASTIKKRRLDAHANAKRRRAPKNNESAPLATSEKS